MKPCCDDLGKAMADKVVTDHAELGVCLLAYVSEQGERLGEPALIPIGFCPWCGKPTPPKLYKSPAFNYRP